MFNRWGPIAPKANVTLEIRMPGDIEIKDFSYYPFVERVSKELTVLRWTQQGSPFSISGFYRFLDPEELFQRLDYKN